MAGNTARLKRIHEETRRILAKHPNMQYRTAQKQAGKKVSGGKVSGRSRHKPKKKVPKKKLKREGIGTHYRVTHHVEKIGKVRVHKKGVSIGSLTVQQAKKAVDEKLAWELLARDSARNVSERKKAQKKINLLKGTKKKLKDL